MSTLPRHELFPGEDFRFRVGVRRGDLEAFFRPTAAGAAILAERRRWLASDPERYAALAPEGGPLLASFHALASGWPHAAGSAVDCCALGGALEPDFLLLAADAAGEFRLHGGALCFPTGWALEEKLGRTVDEIHGVVPGLNAALAPAIGRLLARLAVGESWARVNWGLAATPELNLHPALARPRLAAECGLDEVWLRVEHQILAALPPPAVRGVVFAIRLEITPLRAVLDDPVARRGFAQALATMDDAVAAYKGLAAARPRLLACAAALG
jgi:hypothetical protein